MQTNTGKAFRCLHYRLGSVWVLELDLLKLSYASPVLLADAKGTCQQRWRDCHWNTSLFLISHRSKKSQTKIIC